MGKGQSCQPGTITVSGVPCQVLGLHSLWWQACEELSSQLVCGFSSTSCADLTFPCSCTALHCTLHCQSSAKFSKREGKWLNSSLGVLGRRSGVELRPFPEISACLFSSTFYMKLWSAVRTHLGVSHILLISADTSLTLGLSHPSCTPCSVF